MSLTAMVDIPNQSSNPNMYSFLLSYLTLLVYHLFQRGNDYTLPLAPPFLLESNYSRYLIPYKFVVLSGIAVPCIALSCGVSEGNSPSLAVVVNISFN